MAWVEVQAGIESGHLVKVVVGEWVECEIRVGPCSLLEVVFGAMAESLGGVLVGSLFGAFLEALAAFLFETVFWT